MILWLIFHIIIVVTICVHDHLEIKSLYKFQDFGDWLKRTYLESDSIFYWIITQFQHIRDEL